MPPRIPMLTRLAVLGAIVVASSQQQSGQSGVSIEDLLSDGHAFEAPVTPGAWPPAATSSNANSLLGGAGKGSSYPAAAMGNFTNPLTALLSTDSQILAVEAMDVMTGLTEAFMHKVALQPGEKSCIKRNLGHITGDIMATGRDVVVAVKALMQSKGTVGQDNAAKLASAGLESALKLSSLVTLSTQLVQNCVRGDALEMLKTVGRHLVSAQYLGHRFLVNGVDIAHSLSHSIVAFETKNFRRFGTDVGTVLRKILLSNAINGTRGLPEGVPDQVIIQKITEGLMSGFFVSGAGIIITDTAAPNVNINLNLHRCITGNSAFFKSIWTGLWHLFAQLSVNQDQHGLSPLPGMQPTSLAGVQPATLGKQNQPKWAGELMIAMLQFPMALQKCGIDPSTQRMFMEAIRSLQNVKVKANFPDDPTTALKATDRMARAVEAWTNWKFELFGRQVGILLRELVMLAFPRKYSVDDSGRLRQQLLEEYSAESPGILGSQVILGGQHTSPLLASIVGGCALSILLGLVAVRSIRLAHRDFGDDAPFLDMEGDSCRAKRQELDG